MATASIASQNNYCHSATGRQKQQQLNNIRANQMRTIPTHSSVSFSDKSRTNGAGRKGQRAAVVVASPSHLSSSSRTNSSTTNTSSTLCWCCIRRPVKAVPSSSSPPAVTTTAFGGLASSAAGKRGANGQRAVSPAELCVLGLNALPTNHNQRKQKKKRSSTFSVSSASRGIFPRLHRSLSSQQQHKLFRSANGPSSNHAPPPPPPLDLRSLDAADETPNNTTDYLEVGRAEGGWMRDPNFWRRQQTFWGVQNQQHQQQEDAIGNGDGGVGDVTEAAVGGGQVTGKNGPINDVKEDREQEQHQHQQQVDDMETARTSRTEDIMHYPSMDMLIDEILLTDGEEKKRGDDSDDFKQYIDETEDEGRKSARRNENGSATLPSRNPSPTSFSSSCCSSTRHNSGVLPTATAAVSFPPSDHLRLSPIIGTSSSVSCSLFSSSSSSASVFFTPATNDHHLFMPMDDVCAAATSSATGGSPAGGAVTARQTVLAVPARIRPLVGGGALPALTQSLFDVITVTYVWVASSLALIIQWFL